MQVLRTMGRQGCFEGGENPVANNGALVNRAIAPRQHGTRDTAFVKPTDEIHFANARGQSSKEDSGGIVTEFGALARARSH